MQLEPQNLHAVINRAKRAHGHLGKVISMMEDGSDCDAVLTQLSAVLKALERTGFQIVATGLQQCMASGDGPDSVDVKQMEKLFLGLACAVIVLATVARSRSLLAVGTVALIGYIADFIYQHFAENLGAPLVLMAIGLVFIGAGAAAVRINSRYIARP